MLRLIPLTAVFLTVAYACPLCSPPAQTWSEMMEESDVVVLARILAEKPGDLHNPPTAVVQLVEASHGADHLKQHSSLRYNMLTIDLPVDPHPNGGRIADRLVLLKGQLEDSSYGFNETFATDESGQLLDDGRGQIRQVSATVTEKSGKAAVLPELVIRWDFAQETSRATWNYLQALPQRNRPATERLSWYLGYLEHEDDLIADDAWGEFAQARYEDIRSLKGQYPVEQLRRWLADPETSPTRIVPYALMLGIHGESQDYELFRQQLGDLSDPFPLNLAAYMSGMLLVDAESAVDYLQKHRIQHPDADFDDWKAVLDSLDFLARHEPDRCDRASFKAIVRQLFNREAIRSESLRCLARWKDWDLVERLPEAYRSADPNLDFATVKETINFCVVCQNAADATTDQQQVAAELLTEIRKQFPRDVRSAERLYGASK